MILTPYLWPASSVYHVYLLRFLVFHYYTPSPCEIVCLFLFVLFVFICVYFLFWFMTRPEHARRFHQVKSWTPVEWVSFIQGPLKLFVFRSSACLLQPVDKMLSRFIESASSREVKAVIFSQLLFKNMENSNLEKKCITLPTWAWVFFFFSYFLECRWLKCWVAKASG